MMTSAEMKFVVPKGCSVNVEEEMMPDGSRVVTFTMGTAEYMDCYQREGFLKKFPHLNFGRMMIF